MENQFENKRLKKEIELKDYKILELNNELLKSKNVLLLLLDLHQYDIILNEGPDNMPDYMLIECITSLCEIAKISWVIPSMIYFLKNIYTKWHELVLSRGMISMFEKELGILSSTLVEKELDILSSTLNLP